MKQFSLATHTYFQAVNKDVEKAIFLADDTYIPQFRYKPIFSVENIDKNISTLDDINEINVLRLVRAGASLQKSSYTTGDIEEYRKLNEIQYGAPKPHYTKAILQNIKNRTQQSTAVLFNEITEKIESKEWFETPPHLVGPSENCFIELKKYFNTYTGDLFRNTLSDLPSSLERALETTKLQNKGWSVQLLDDSSPARTVRRTKRIVVGAHYVPRRTNSVGKIVAHEVFGHALRNTSEGSFANEGFAVLLEQLLSPSFTFRRSYRYLAASLGWGVSGKRMDFREVYEILWRSMVIMSSYDIPSAKSHAFDECYRVFRGGVPSIPGAIYLKDTVYFAGNIAVWKRLEESSPTYEQFVEIIEGRRKALS